MTSEREGSSSTESRDYIRKLLNKLIRVKLTDGRVLVGQFLCTDKEANVILGSCAEYVPASGDMAAAALPDSEDDLDGVIKETPDPRVLGLAMVKGRDIVTMHFDSVPGPPSSSHQTTTQPQATPVAQNTEQQSASQDQQMCS